jgi:hypothetical protein
MVVLDDGWSYVLLFGTAAIMGGLGGLVYELLRPFRRRAGLLEVPSSFQRSHLNLGFWSGIVVGAVAAMAALWAMPPETVIVNVVGEESTSTSSYDIVRVVGLSLIVGSAGGTFITALQARALLLIKNEELAAEKQKSADVLTLLGEGASPDQSDVLHATAPTPPTLKGGSSAPSVDVRNVVNVLKSPSGSRNDPAVDF